MEIPTKESVITVPDRNVPSPYRLVTKFGSHILKIVPANIIRVLVSIEDNEAESRSIGDAILVRLTQTVGQ